MSPCVWSQRRARWLDDSKRCGGEGGGEEQARTEDLIYCRKRKVCVCLLESWMGWIQRLVNKSKVRYGSSCGRLWIAFGSLWPEFSAFATTLHSCKEMLGRQLGSSWETQRMTRLRYSPSRLSSEEVAQPRWNRTAEDRWMQSDSPRKPPTTSTCPRPYGRQSCSSGPITALNKK